MKNVIGDISEIPRFFFSFFLYLGNTVVTRLTDVRRNGALENAGFFYTLVETRSVRGSIPAG